jgi:hypothetical protein
MRRLLAVSLAAASLAGLVGCGANTPARPARKVASQPLNRAPLQGMQPGVAGQLAPGAVDPRVAQILQGVAQVRDQSQGADVVVKITYYKDDGSIKHVRSRYKFQKPQRNFIEVLASNEDKVVGTKVSWKGDGKASVRTKFIGFWVTVSLDLHDDRLRDQRGNFLDETSISRALETLLDPGARVTFKGEGNLAGRPMVVLDVVSPLSLKNVTREVYGIDPTINQPIMREMYKGDKLIWKMNVESAKVNPTFSSKDFAVD